METYYEPCSVEGDELNDLLAEDLFFANRADSSTAYCKNEEPITAWDIEVAKHYARNPAPAITLTKSEYEAAMAA